MHKINLIYTEINIHIEYINLAGCLSAMELNQMWAAGGAATVLLCGGSMVVCVIWITFHLSVSYAILSNLIMYCNFQCTSIYLQLAGQSPIYYRAVSELALST